MRKLYDSVNISGIPASATFIAAYANGHYANVTEARQHFPHAEILTIDVTGDDPSADVLDYEPGNVHDIATAAGWVQLKRALSPASQPTVYSDLFDFPVLVKGLAHYGLVLGTHWFSWLADPGANPASFESVKGVVAVQDLWAGSYDSSDVWVAQWHPYPVPVPPPVTPGPVSCTVTWQVSSGPVTRHAEIPWSAWNAIKWLP